MKNVLVIGSVNMDMVIETPRMPKMGETVTGTSFKTVQGGKGANQADAAAKLGCSTRFIGCVGKDAAGDELLKSLSSFGVDTSFVERVDDSSGVAVIPVCDSDNCIMIYPGANAHLTKEVIDKNEESFKWADIVVLQFESPMETVFYAAKTAKRHGAIVLLNPAPMKDFDKRLLDYVDIFVPNSVEAAQLVGKDDINVAEVEAVIEYVRDFGVELVIVTMGKDGCVYNSGSDILHMQAYKVSAVDTTAAGDSFIGGICAGLCSDMDISKSIAYATAVSAIAVSREGASVSIPSKTEVKDFIKSQKENKL